MNHHRHRPFNTRDVYPGRGHDNDMCMAVRAGRRIFLRGQTGLDLDQNLVDPLDPAAQAAQAMRNVRTLLAEAGAGMQDICKLIIYITDRAYRIPVYQAMAPFLDGCAPARTGLVVKGLAMPELKMEVDVEAVVPGPEAPRRDVRSFGFGSWNDEPLDGLASHAVVTGEEIFLTGQIGTPLGSGVLAGTGHTPRAAAAQAAQTMRKVRILLEEAGAGMEDICKLRIYLGDRAYREAVYQVLGEHLGEARPCATGLIVSGFAWPEILFEIDVAAAPGPHQLIRPYDTQAWYRDGQDLRCRFAMARRTGRRVYLRGQTGHDLDGGFHGGDDPAQQAHQAMRNVRILLEEAGARMEDVCQVTTYVSDRGYRERVYRAIGEHLRGVHPVGTGLVMNGFASTEIAVEVDVEAVIA